MVTFGGRGMFRLRRLLALHGYSTDTQTIQQAQSLLKPYAKMELKLISRLIQRGEEDETEADIFSSVKKLLNHGQLEPIPFGQMVSRKSILRELIFNPFLDLRGNRSLLSSFPLPSDWIIPLFWFVPSSFTPFQRKQKSKSKSQAVPKKPTPSHLRGKRFRLRSRSRYSFFFVIYLYYSSFPPRKFFFIPFLLFYPLLSFWKPIFFFYCKNLRLEKF